MTNRTRFEWIRFREYDKLLYGKRFPPKLNGTVQQGYSFYMGVKYDQEIK